MTSAARYTTWKPEYSVGILSVDQQHKKLIELIGDLEKAMSAGHGPEVLERTFGELVRYTLAHFAHEEELMRRTGYVRDFMLHKAEHDKLRAEALLVQGELQSGRIVMSVQVLHFLSDWLTRHIMDTDKRYSKHMKTHGVV